MAVRSDFEDFHDAGMIQQCNGFGLVSKPANFGLLVKNPRSHQLQSDSPVQADLTRQVNHPHTAPTKRAMNFVIAEILDFRACSQGRNSGQAGRLNGTVVDDRHSDRILRRIRIRTRMRLAPGGVRSCGSWRDFGLPGMAWVVVFLSCVRFRNGCPIGASTPARVRFGDVRSTRQRFQVRSACIAQGVTRVSRYLPATFRTSIRVLFHYVHPVRNDKPRNSKRVRTAECVSDHCFVIMAIT